jgi:hypothetical protein
MVAARRKYIFDLNLIFDIKLDNANALIEPSKPLTLPPFPY